MAKTEYARDDFQRADANPASDADLGGAWSSYQQTLRVLSNEGYVSFVNAGTGWAKLRAQPSTIADCIVSGGVYAGVSAGTGYAIGVTLRARADQDSNAIVGYFLQGLFAGASSAWSIQKRTGATTTAVATGSATTLSAATYYKTALKASGNDLSAWAWVPGQLPPSTPTLTGTDSSITAAGCMGARFSNNTGSTTTGRFRKCLLTDLAAPGDVSSLAAELNEGAVDLTWTRATDRGACFHKLFREINGTATPSSTLVTGSATDLSGIASDGRFGAASWWDGGGHVGPSALTGVSIGAAAAGDTVHYLLVAYDVSGTASSGVEVTVEIPSEGAAAGASPLTAAMMRRRRR